MAADYTIVLELALVAMGAVLGGWACRKMGIPEVLGYLSAGIVLGPAIHPGGFVDSNLIQNITYFAVVFRMFILGLDFDARRLRGRWGPALSAGLLEMGLSTAAGTALAYALGWPLLHGAILGAALGTTSTSILSKALADRNMSTREDARAAGAATLTEDLLAMALVAGLGLWVGATPGGVFDAGALWSTAVELLVFASLAFTAGAVLMPLFIDRLSRAHSEELLTLAVVAVLFAFAALSDFLHAGRPVGAFLAGIAVGAARHAPGVSARMLPLRDLLAAAAYVGMGLLLKPALILEMLPYALAAVPIFVVIKVVSVSVGLRLGGVPTVVAARAGGILGQVGTMGIVIACTNILGDPNSPATQETVGRLAAFAFVAWIVTVSLTGLRLRYLPDIMEKAVRILGARDVANPRHRLPRGSDADALAAARTGILALGCAVALAALAGLVSQATLLLADILVAPAAVAIGLAASLLAIPFIVLVSVALRETTHSGVHRAALRPTRLSNGRGEGAKPWAVTGTLVGLGLAALATGAMAYAVAPTDARLWLLSGAGLAVLIFVVRQKALLALIAWSEGLLERRQPPDVRLHDFRGVNPFGYEVEAVLVRAGTRAAWAKVGELDLKDRTGASIIAVLRPGTMAPLALAPTTSIPPGAEVVVGGTMAQVVAAKRYLLEASNLRAEDGSPAEHGHLDAHAVQPTAPRIA